MTQQRLELITEIFITANDFKKMSKKVFGTKVEGFEKLEHGEFLGRRVNEV